MMKKDKRRKFFTVLPLLVIPFLALGFYALGGGRPGKDMKTADNKVGLNLQLPNSSVKEDRKADKLSFYEKMDKDSLKFRQAMSNDPYYKKNSNLDSSNELQRIAGSLAAKYGQGLNVSPYHADGKGGDASERIMNKIAELNKVINEPQKLQQLSMQKVTGRNSVDDSRRMSSDIDKLRNMVAMMGNSNEEDTEMKKLETVLDKIIEVQHPERTVTLTKQQKEMKGRQVFPVGVTEGAAARDTGFYCIDMIEKDTALSNVFAAMVPQSQVLVPGSIIQLRLLQNIPVHGMVVPAGTSVYGISSLQGERLNISIPGLRYGNVIIPVKMEVIDLDGMPGIYIPGAIGRDVAKQSADNGLQSLQLTSLDPSIGAQAASAGINAAKTLISRKAKLVRVTVKAGYKVFLRDESNQ